MGFKGCPTRQMTLGSQESQGDGGNSSDKQGKPSQGPGLRDSGKTKVREEDLRADPAGGRPASEDIAAFSSSRPISLLGILFLRSSLLP